MAKTRPRPIRRRGKIAKTAPIPSRRVRRAVVEPSASNGDVASHAAPSNGHVPVPSTTAEHMDSVPREARWKAYEAMVLRLESASGVKLELMHKALDTEGMEGQGFGTILLKAASLFDIPATLAGIVVRTYPGFHGEGPDFEDAQAFAAARRKQKFPVPEGWQPWFV